MIDRQSNTDNIVKMYANVVMNVWCQQKFKSKVQVKSSSESKTVVRCHHFSRFSIVGIGLHTEEEIREVQGGIKYFTAVV